MTSEQKQFLKQACLAARKGGHVFPEMAACEAALESSYGRSLLATKDNNLFGMKQHKHPIYGTHSLPTREYQHGQWVVVTADWVSYPDVASCFADRMSTLQRLASTYPHYDAALRAGSAVTFVNEVSQTWSTDPRRADKVLAIYDAMAGDWNPDQTIDV